MITNCCTPGCPNEREMGSARCPACKRTPVLVFSKEVPEVPESRVCFDCGEAFAPRSVQDQLCCSHLCSMRWANKHRRDTVLWPGCPNATDECPAPFGYYADRVTHSPDKKKWWKDNL